MNGSKIYWAFILFLGLLLCSSFILGLVTHSFRIAGPIMIFFGYLLLGITTLNSGRKKLQERRKQGEQAPWYKEHQMDSGIALLLFGVFFLSEPVVINVSNTKGDIILYIVVAVLGIPMLVLWFLAFKYRSRK